MTTPASTTPISVDYTGRDYYALREALIERIKGRVPSWQGNDENDFGVALAEAFAYMGDLINYYIDRIANESYIQTATQRQSIINLAEMLGYKASGYSAATVDVTFTSNLGYKGDVGASALTDGIAELEIPRPPNFPPFVTGDVVVVTGMARSEYNGVFTVSIPSVLTDDPFTMSYVPANYSVSNFTIPGVSITGISGSGTYITITTNVPHTLTAAQQINITGVTPSAYNLTNATVYDVPSVTTFRIASTLTNTYTSGGAITAKGISHSGTYITINTTVEHFIKAGQKVNITGVNPTAYNLTNATVYDVPTTKSFRIESTLTNTYTSGGTVKYSNIDAVDTITKFAIRETGSIVVPSGTQLAADVIIDSVVQQIIFSTVEDAVLEHVTPNGQAGTVETVAVHGVNVSTLEANAANGDNVAGELLGESDGSPNQEFSLKNTEVDATYIKVYVEREEGIFEEWSVVTHIEDSAPGDTTYAIYIDGDENIYIRFGDGVAGAIPPRNARVKATYNFGAGSIGNIPSYSMPSIYDVPGALQRDIIMSKVSVLNAVAATGGTQAESDESIRYNAPKSLRALNRAVTLEDFSNLTLQVFKVGKSNATATSPSSVVVYVAPQRDPASLDLTPGILPNGTLTPEIANLKSSVATFLADKIQIGTTVTVLEPTYVPISVTVRYSVLPQYSSTSVEATIKKTLVSEYAYANTSFAQVITPQDIENIVRSIPGVQNAVVSLLYRTPGGGLNSLVGNPDEMFYLADSNIELSAASSVSTLSGLVVSYNGTEVTLSPSFNSNVINYSGAISGNYSLSVTPTGSSDTTITVNNTATASGSSWTTVLDSEDGPVYRVIITVTAQDNVTTTNYVVALVKS
jgi:hypothetical protein